jgi:hypothetical protein
VTIELVVTSPQRIVSHFLSPGNFLPRKSMTVVPHPTYFPLFPQLKANLIGHHFYTTEVIEAELQKVVNTLTEHDFQDVFKKY